MRRPARARAVAVLLAGAALATGAAGCGASPTAARSDPPRYAGRPVPDPGAAPPIVLRDADGRRVDLAGERGRAVLVTFLYTHCPDTCPLIAEHLRATLEGLGRASDRVALIAVSTDPRGDTPRAVRRFLAQHRLRGRLTYAIGTRAQLARVWRAWGIAAAPGARPDEVEHTATLFGVTAGGRLATLYSPDVRPQTLMHDVPLLAGAR